MKAQEGSNNKRRGNEMEKGTRVADMRTGDVRQ